MGIVAFIGEYVVAYFVVTVVVAIMFKKKGSE